MLIKEAREITGGLSKPSKMPGPAYNLPASQCITGAKLVNVKGSTCSGCYALKGNYIRFYGKCPELFCRTLKINILTNRWIWDQVKKK